MLRTLLSLAWPVPSCSGRGKNLGFCCLDAPRGSVCCPVPGLWVCSCTGGTEAVSRPAEVRPHFCLFNLQNRDLGRRLSVNINIPFSEEEQAHVPPTWTAGCLEGIWRSLWALMGLGLYPLLWGVSRRWRLLLPCPAGKALTLNSPRASRAESSLVLTQNSRAVNYWLVISSHFLSRTCKLRLLFSWQRSIKGKGNASILRGCVAVGFEKQILTWRSVRLSHSLFQTPPLKFKFFYLLKLSEQTLILLTNSCFHPTR